MLIIDFSTPPMLTTNHDDFQQDSLDRQVSMASTRFFIVTDSPPKKARLCLTITDSHTPL